jgi:hypothetical protein
MPRTKLRWRRTSLQADGNLKQSFNFDVWTYHNLSRPEVPVATNPTDPLKWSAR